MGRRVITRPLDMSDYALQVNKRDNILNDVWGRGHYSFGDWIPNTDPSNNDELLGQSLDLIEEQRENAMVQLAYYQHKFK